MYSRLKILVLVVFMFFTFTATIGQSTIDNFCDSLWVTGDYSTGNILAETFYNAYPALKGQYFQSWAKGSVYYTDGTVIKDKMLCYHGYTDNLHWQRQSDKQVGVIPKQAIHKVVFKIDKHNSILFQKVNLHLPMTFGDTDVLIQVLAQGNIGLYCYRKVKYIKNSDEGFYSDYQYFIKNSKGYTPINLSKSAFLSQFSKEEKIEINQIIKKEKLKVKREADMVKAITIYNQKIKQKHHE